VCTLIAVLLLLLPAAALASAVMQSPARAKVGSRIKISASGLKPGHYSLVLVIETLPGGAGPTNCVGSVGSQTARAGRLAITGVLPARLACYMGVGAVEGYMQTRPGSYDLTLCVQFHPDGCSIKSSFVMRKVRLTS
jgi:hypothetical protein